jgi:gag-polypeptide of LTR copia-type
MDDETPSTIQLRLSNATLEEVRLKLCFYTLCMDEDTYLSDHLTKFISILNDLDKLGVNVEDEDQALLLLYSLSISYKTFRDMMVYSREKISLEDVKYYLQTKLHLNNDMIIIEKGIKVLAWLQIGAGLRRKF